MSRDLPQDPEPQALRKRRRMGFGSLLAGFLLYFLYAGLSHALGLDTQSLLSRGLNALITAVLLSAAALAVSDTPTTRLATRGFLGFILILLALSKYHAESDIWDTLYHVGTALFVAWSAYLIIRMVWQLQRADSEAIAAALCAFLMLGLLWTVIYSLLGHVDPDAFPGVSIEMGGEEPLAPLYFSFVTLTTLGYGDISPVSPGARMFAILEAIVGQIFLVVFVARLVGLSIATAEIDRRRSED